MLVGVKGVMWVTTNTTWQCDSKLKVNMACSDVTGKNFQVMTPMRVTSGSNKE